MKKLVLIGALLCMVLLSGCAKGEITLEISRWGAADLSCKLVTAPVISGALTSFKDDFKQDGYMVTEAEDGEMTGFLAHKHYNHLADIKDSKVLETFKFSRVQKAAKEAGKKQENKTGEKQKATPKEQNKGAQKPLATVQSGWLMDTVTVHTGLDWKNDKAGQKSFDEQYIMKNLLKSVSMKFILILPTTTENNNATTVSADGKTLTWVLPMGENTPIDMTFTYVNPVKAASWLGLVVILFVAGIVARSYGKNKKQSLEKEA